MRLQRVLVAASVGAAFLMASPTRAEALDRCAGADPFTPAVKADVANRLGGHHITATAHDSRTGCTCGRR